MPTPHTCPVCNGHGTVSRPPWIAGDAQTWTGSTAQNAYPCRACVGTGLVWEPDEPPLDAHIRRALLDAHVERYTEAARRVMHDLDELQKLMTEAFEKEKADAGAGESDAPVQEFTIDGLAVGQPPDPEDCSGVR